MVDAQVGDRAAYAVHMGTDARLNNGMVVHRDQSPRPRVAAWVEHVAPAVKRTPRARVATSLCARATHANAPPAGAGNRSDVTRFGVTGRCFCAAHGLAPVPTPSEKGCTPHPIPLPPGSQARPHAARNVRFRTFQNPNPNNHLPECRPSTQRNSAECRAETLHESASAGELPHDPATAVAGLDDPTRVRRPPLARRNIQR